MPDTAIDRRRVAASSAAVPGRIGAMADDASTFIKAPDVDQLDICASLVDGTTARESERLDPLQDQAPHL